MLGCSSNQNSKSDCIWAQSGYFLTESRMFSFSGTSKSDTPSRFVTRELLQPDACFRPASRYYFFRNSPELKAQLQANRVLLHAVRTARCFPDCSPFRSQQSNEPVYPPEVHVGFCVLCPVRKIPSGVATWKISWRSIDGGSKDRSKGSKCVGVRFSLFGSCHRSEATALTALLWLQWLVWLVMGSVQLHHKLHTTKLTGLHWTDQSSFNKHIHTRSPNHFNYTKTRL